jgi:hypothetical protein
MALTGKRFTQYQHPLYQAWLPIWQKLAHAFEGIGGFTDGTYLIPHPREWRDHSAKVKTTDPDTQIETTTWIENPNPRMPTAKLLERRRLARYENWARKIVKAFSGSLFRQGPTRIMGGGTKRSKTGETPIEKWWTNVDGAGLDIDDFWPQIWAGIATFGHVYLYMDRPKQAAPTSGETRTAADAPQPFLRTYTPIDVPDWVDELGVLKAVKFLEPAPRAALDQPFETAQYRVRYVDENEWRLYDQTGKQLDQGAHQFGCLPVVIVFGDRRPLIPLIGASLLGDPSLFIDYYNLISEHRELLRKQTFSIINIPIGDEGSVESEKALLGQQIGTGNVLFSHKPAEMLSPGAENTAAYERAEDKLLRAIFRLAGIGWEADSRDAEATGSLLVKREDLNTQLSQYADEIERADYAIAKLFYLATKGADQGEQAYMKDAIQTRFPDTFDVTPFADLLEEAQAALNLGMPIEFKQELRKRLVDKFLPDLPDDLKNKILAAIDQQAEEASPLAAARQALVDRMKQAGAMPVPGDQAPAVAGQ